MLKRKKKKLHIIYFQKDGRLGVFHSCAHIYLIELNETEKHVAI